METVPKRSQNAILENVSIVKMTKVVHIRTRNACQMDHVLTASLIRIAMKPIFAIWKVKFVKPNLACKTVIVNKASFVTMGHAQEVAIQKKTAMKSYCATRNLDFVWTA